MRLVIKFPDNALPEVCADMVREALRDLRHLGNPAVPGVRFTMRFPTEDNYMDDGWWKLEDK